MAEIRAPNATETATASSTRRHGGRLGICSESKEKILERHRGSPGNSGCCYQARSISPKSISDFDLSQSIKRSATRSDYEVVGRAATDPKCSTVQRMLGASPTTRFPAPRCWRASRFRSHPGLTDAEAGRRLKRYGPNTIVVHRTVPAFRVLLHQFQSAVVYLLSAAAVLAFYFREWEEGSAIAVVLALNTLIGFVTELRAARSIEALRTLGTRSARVRRDGHVVSDSGRENGARRYRSAGGRRLDFGRRAAARSIQSGR